MLGPLTGPYYAANLNGSGGGGLSKATLYEPYAEGASNLLAAETWASGTVTVAGGAAALTVAAANGYAASRTGDAAGAGTAPLRLGDGTAPWSWQTSKLTIPTASDAAERFIVLAGFFSSVWSGVSGGTTPSAAFVYDTSGAWGAASGNWKAVTHNGTLGTVTDTGIPAVATSALRVEVSADGAAVSFVVNGAPVAVHTTTIPASTVGMYGGVDLYGVASTGAARSLTIADQLIKQV